MNGFEIKEAFFSPCSFNYRHTVYTFLAKITRKNLQVNVENAEYSKVSI